MSRFDLTNFCSLTEDGLDLDLFSAKFNSLSLVATSARVITINSTTEANLPYIADKYLGSSRLWWTLLMYNGLLDPIEDIVIGLKLAIPSRSSLITILESGNRSNISVIEI
jgi:hypothetical protein